LVVLEVEGREAAAWPREAYPAEVAAVEVEHF